MHCAFNMNKNIFYNDFDSYLQDTIRLTEKVLSLPHKIFVLSSIDIYPVNGKYYDETKE